LVGKQPYDQVAGLIDKIRGQAAPQLVAFAQQQQEQAAAGEQRCDAGSVAASLGFDEAWRLDPNTFAAVLRRMAGQKK
jgi:hypothetical protein